MKRIYWYGLLLVAALVCLELGSCEAGLMDYPTLSVMPLAKKAAGSG